MRATYTTELRRIYPKEVADPAEQRLRVLLDQRRGRIRAPAMTELTERDSILIAYPDQLRQEGEAPSRTLAAFCERHLAGVVSSVHVLPFFPSSSDEGFSVKDYRSVDPALGDWATVERLGRSFRLVIDAVINHASAEGLWFKSFLRDEEPYAGYFLRVDPSMDLLHVVRPRPSPPVTEFMGPNGPRRMWTTFSADQVDLDYHNPGVLLEIIDILLDYVQRGAQFLRLDAVAYLWKESGTTCLHLAQTHAIVQLLRAILDDVAPHVRLITETNVPHTENVTYFGNGRNEAQVVYNFALPPLVLHTFRAADATMLAEWARGLDTPSDECSFLNFLASHDGIGLNAVRGILSKGDIERLVEQTLAHGGEVSQAAMANGQQSVYELNINYFDALSDPLQGEPTELQVKRFLAAHAIMLCLRGVPAIYFHSMFGSRNWMEGPQIRGTKRAINRQRLLQSDLEAELQREGSLRSQVFGGLRRLLLLRSARSAFDPHGQQEVLDAGGGVLAVRRTSPVDGSWVLCLQNVTAERQRATLPEASPSLEPYETLWIDSAGS